MESTKISLELNQIILWGHLLFWSSVFWAFSHLIFGPPPFFTENNNDEMVYFLFKQLIQQCIGGLLLNLTLEQFKEVEGKANMKFSENLRAHRCQASIVVSSA